ncbi:MAG: glycogen synthase GlgA [Planctomycetales bacterium]|nr:glycogen synthase GlgA [Planctomycetales bacterium]
MNIVIASSEVVPFAKTGGLADVCGSLPIEIAKLGHRPFVFLPAFRQAKESGQPLSDTHVKLEIPIGSRIVSGRILQSVLPGSNVPVYLIEQDEYFDRKELYRESGEDYKDNCERFVFFCRAVLEAIRLLDLDIDLIHCNDWQTGLIPAYLKIEYENAPGYENMASLMTIHNMAYQGQFWHWDMLLTGIDWKFFNWHQMEFYGKLNLLKTGLVFCDSINTVSPTYAKEIQSAPLGCGLEEVLSCRRDVLSGIINGVNYDVWSPENDPYLNERFSADNWQAGKASAKRLVQSELGLPEIENAPLIGIVGRLADQKGFDLIAPVMEQWLKNHDVQWAVLGTGEAQYHHLLEQLAARFPGKLAVRLEFSDRTAHLIEAGSDIFLMPSRYEPCGLNQLYSLRYGTVPVVHATGGLVDTIADTNGENLAQNRATGFVFDMYKPASLESALMRACDTYRNDKSTWSQLINTGMRQDWSWQTSAQKYVDLYELTIQRANQAVCA